MSRSEDVRVTREEFLDLGGNIRRVERGQGKVLTLAFWYDEQKSTLYWGGSMFTPDDDNPNLSRDLRLGNAQTAVTRCISYGLSHVLTPAQVAELPEGTSERNFYFGRLLARHLVPEKGCRNVVIGPDGTETRVLRDVHQIMLLRAASKERSRVRDSKPPTARAA